MKDKIKQIVIKDDSVLIFTDEPEKDVLILREEYEKRDDVETSFPLGYEIPCLSEYNFLGKKYPCISLWFDNEDIPDFFTENRFLY